MSVLCNIVTAVGLTLGGACAEPSGEVQMNLPDEDKSVWDYKAPVKEEPKPKPAPVFPPVTVTKTIIKEIPAPAPPPPEPEPIPEPKPNPYRLWLEAQRNQPSHMASLNEDWTEIDVTAAKGAPGNPDSLTAPSLPTMRPPESTPKTYDYEGVTSGEPVPNDRIVTADRYITGNLEGGINSQLASDEGGDVVIQVSRHVFGYGTRNILIPKGSRLICNYESPASLSATRFPMECFRILLAGDKQGKRVEIVQLASRVGDAQGRGGLTGQVNNHFEKQYGTALMLAGISAAVRGASAMATTGENQDSTTADIADKASQELGTRFGEISASVLEKTTNIAPTITASQGKRVQIRPRKDWYLKEIN